MKKLLYLCFFSVFLCSCAPKTLEESKEDYYLTDKDKIIFGTILETELQSYGWTYNPSEIRFGEGIIPDKSDERYELLKKLSRDTGYEYDLWQGGEKVATAFVVIFHPNGDLGGEARFYFKDNSIICGYYTYRNNIYAIDNLSVFLADYDFSAHENTGFDGRDYNEADISVPFRNVSSVSPNSGMAAVIEDDTLNFYTLRTSSFGLSKSYSEDDFGYIPMDVDFDTDGSCAILLGSRDDNDELISRKIIILDNLLNPKDNDFLLYSGSYENMVYDNGIITLSNGSSLSEFDALSHQNIDNKHLIHYINGMASFDIYGNGTRLIVITDNKNIYVYSDKYELLWRTYNQEETYGSDIYFADSNLDGVKEIYIENITTGSTDKFILTETGFTSVSTISPTSKLITGDFDCNGRYDILAVNADSKKIYY